MSSCKKEFNKAKEFGSSNCCAPEKSILARVQGYEKLSQAILDVKDELYQLDTALTKNRNECQHRLVIFYREFETDLPLNPDVFFGNMICTLCGKQLSHAQCSHKGNSFMLDVTRLKTPVVPENKFRMVKSAYAQIAEQFFESNGFKNPTIEEEEEILQRLSEKLKAPYYRVLKLR